MNYEPNTVQWKIGDIVIHDADEKKEHMLMVVVGFEGDGLVLTRYLNHPRLAKRVWTNYPRYLHDPARFGIEVKK